MDNKYQNILIRSIEEQDFDSIKRIHEELFPVKYADSFYVDACKGIGLYKGVLFSRLAIEDGKLVGFIFAQLLDYPRQCEDRDLFSIRRNQPSTVCYIMTIGVELAYRKSGLGSYLLKHCIDYASASEGCGAVRDINSLHPKRPDKTHSVILPYLMYCLGYATCSATE
jgi:ribosomal protein S18 acetylase RimI-like enzyme